MIYFLLASNYLFQTNILLLSDRIFQVAQIILNNELCGNEEIELKRPMRYLFINSHEYIYRNK